MSIRLLTILCLAATGAQAENPTPPAPTAKAPSAKRVEIVEDAGTWLVHLAQHQGHLLGRTDPRSASLHVLALLEAAVQVAPDNAEAHYWRYDILSRLDRQDAAKTALARYVELTPSDDSARIRFTEMEIQDRQTAQARAEYVQEQLKQPGLSRLVESAMRGRLAEFFYERRENENAAREVERALRLNPSNIAAREIAYEMFGETEPALQRVELALQMIASNPSQTNLVWDLAEFLDQLSMHKQAQEWYTRAIDLHQRAGEGPVPASFWHKLAMSYTYSGDFTRAKTAAEAAITQDPKLYGARLLRSNAELRLDDAKGAAADMDAVARAYDARIPEVVSGKKADEAAEIAWFYCYHKPDKDKALQLAKIAMEPKSAGSLARLAYGYALRLNSQEDEAIKTLEPLASVDQLAALELARAYIDKDRKSEALTVLHKAATLQYSGIAFDMIRDLLVKYGETAPEAPIQTKIAEGAGPLRPPGVRLPQATGRVSHVHRLVRQRESRTGRPCPGDPATGERRAVPDHLR